MPSRYGAAALGGLLLGGSLLSPSLGAQQTEVATLQKSPTPVQLLKTFEAEARGLTKGSPRAGLEISHILLRREQYPAGTVQELLSGLERLALQSTSSRVRADAALQLGTPGLRTARNAMPGTVTRLLRVYRQSSDPLVRGVVIARLASVAERRDAIEFIRSVALQDPSQQDFPGAAFHAIATLVAMDEDGRMVLRELHEKQLVKDLDARSGLAEWAKRGFRVGA